MRAASGSSLAGPSLSRLMHRPVSAAIVPRFAAFCAHGLVGRRRIPPSNIVTPRTEFEAAGRRLLQRSASFDKLRTRDNATGTTKGRRGSGK